LAALPAVERVIKAVRSRAAEQIDDAVEVKIFVKAEDAERIPLAAFATPIVIGSLSRIGKYERVPFCGALKAWTVQATLYHATIGV